MNRLNCYIDIFSYKQAICYDNKKKETVSMDELIPYLLTTCHEQNIPMIHFHGTTDYINGLVEQFRTEEATKYGNIQIKIEVN